ncbi:MAG: hypothetical protein AAF565_16195, partial [Pseudomonadota bacterium]
EVRFSDGAPVDRIIVENVSPQGWLLESVDIAFAGSAGRLVIDVVPGGEGFNVAQPLRVAAGAQHLAAIPTAEDGDEALALDFAAMPTGESVTLTLDLDDRLPGGTRVDGAEIAGASVTASFGHRDGGQETHEGLFGPEAAARAGAPCLG